MTEGDTVTVYPDGSGHWRWHTKAANGRTIATSGEAFNSRSNAVRAARRANPGIPFTVEGDE